MKKLILAAGLVLAFASTARASWVAFYTGNSYLPSPGADQLYTSPAATFSGMSQPSSPTPGEGNRWLANPVSNTDYVSLPTSIITAAGTFEFYFRYNTYTASTQYDLLRISQLFNSAAIRIQYDGPNQQLLVYEGTTLVIQTGGNSFTYASTQTITFTYNATQITLQIGSGSVFTAAGYTPASVNGIYAMGSPQYQPSSGAQECFLDGLAFGNTVSESYPPVGPTPTVTPTTSPTLTTTPTRTATISATATPTQTLSWTPTASQTSTPTVSHTGTPTWTPTITKTNTQTNTPTTSPTPTWTPTTSPTPTWTPTPTPTPTALPTPFVFSIYGQLTAPFRPLNCTDYQLAPVTNWASVNLNVTIQPAQLELSVPETSAATWRYWFSNATTTPTVAGIAALPGDYAPAHPLRIGERLWYKAIGATTVSASAQSCNTNGY